jgi:hypothetical protein
MTERQKKLDTITDDLYYYMVEIVSKASDLESLGYNKDGEELRSVADRIERLAIRLLDRMNKNTAN